ncbi:unnamed protein product [Closterium sp. NIES-65]|nr:unnamed protein product [Closterium sp. NIES-65]
MLRPFLICLLARRPSARGAGRDGGGMTHGRQSQRCLRSLPVLFLHSLACQPSLCSAPLQPTRDAAGEAEGHTEEQQERQQQHGEPQAAENMRRPVHPSLGLTAASLRFIGNGRDAALQRRRIAAAGEGMGLVWSCPFKLGGSSGTSYVTSRGADPLLLLMQGWQ